MVHAKAVGGSALFSIEGLFFKWQGFVVWMLYGAGIYWIVLGMHLEKKINGKIFLQGMFCGILTGLVKGILDTAVINFVLLKLDITLCANAVFLEITTLLTGLSLFLVLFLKGAKTSFSIKYVKWPLLFLLSLAVAYGALCGKCIYMEKIHLMISQRLLQEGMKSIDICSNVSIALVADEMHDNSSI